MVKRSIVAALVLGASLAGAQQTVTTRRCVATPGTVSYDAGDVSKAPETRPYTDTTTKAVKVNAGGNSVPITATNTTNGSTAEVSTGERAVVDSSRVAPIPARNSDRNAVKVNVGGGSAPVNRVDNASSKSTVKDTTVNVPVVVVECADSVKRVP